MKNILLASCLIFLAVCPALAQDGERAALAEAVGWIRETNHIVAEYDYEMSVKIRLVVFWLGKDNVGGGYIRRLDAPADPRLKSIEVLFGSDPAKTKGVNRWGAGTEVMRYAEADGRDLESSAFLGFMKASKGESVAAMQAELHKEKTNNQFLFDATVTRADRGRVLARTTPFVSNEDYTFSQLARASATVMERLDQSDRPVRRSKPNGVGGAGGAECNRAAGFLSTVQELIATAEAGQSSPASLCYFFNAREYTATLKSWKALDQAVTHNPAIAYRRLIRASFTVLNHGDNKTSTFELLVPRDGPLKGIPVEIVHQPNWWFEVILSLQPTVALRAP